LTARNGGFWPGQSMFEELLNPGRLAFRARARDPRPQALGIEVSKTATAVSGSPIVNRWIRTLDKELLMGRWVSRGERATPRPLPRLPLRPARAQTRCPPGDVNAGGARRQVEVGVRVGGGVLRRDRRRGPRHPRQADGVRLSPAEARHPDGVLSGVQTDRSPWDSWAQVTPRVGRLGSPGFFGLSRLSQADG
jgi:hypothetical protein